MSATETSACLGLIKNPWYLTTFVHERHGQGLKFEATHLEDMTFWNSALNEFLCKCRVDHAQRWGWVGFLRTSHPFKMGWISLEKAHIHKNCKQMVLQITPCIWPMKWTLQVKSAYWMRNYRNGARVCAVLRQAMHSASKVYMTNKFLWNCHFGNAHTIPNGMPNTVEECGILIYI